MPITVLDHISPTSLVTFGTCRLQWKWSHPDGYKAKGRSYNLDLGIGVHLALGARYTAMMNKKKPVDMVKVFTLWADAEISKLNEKDALYDEDIQTLAAIRTMGIAMLEGYQEKYLHEPFEVLQVEKEVSLPIPGTTWTLQARIDTVVRDLNMNKVFVLEHKTFSRTDVGYLDKDHQLVAETWLANELVDEPVAGIIYNGLRKKIPSAKTKLPMFERYYITVNETQVGWMLRRAKAMHNVLTQPKVSIYPEPSFMACTMCRFKDVCTEFQRGGDFQFLLDTMYTKRPDEPVEEEGPDE